MKDYYNQCSAVKAKREAAAAAKAAAAATAAAASTTTSTSTKKSKKTPQTKAKKELVDAMSMFSTEAQKVQISGLFKKWNVSLPTLKDLKTNFDKINTRLKALQKAAANANAINIMTNAKQRRQLNNYITLISNLLQNIKTGPLGSMNAYKRLKINRLIVNKNIPYIEYTKNIFQLNRTWVRNTLLTIIPRPEVAPVSGGSKKTRTVTIKSNAMPKTVKGLQTRKKLLKKKIKKAEKKVKLSKDRIIRLK